MKTTSIVFLVIVVALIAFVAWYAFHKSIPTSQAPKPSPPKQSSADAAYTQTLGDYLNSLAGKELV